MDLFTSCHSYLEEEDGAITVDWVVLTAAVVGLGIAVVTTMGNATTGLADKISAVIATTSIYTY